jgi:hypothetical protein
MKLKSNNGVDAPESITTPAIVVPWPPIHLVALSTNGRTNKFGIAQYVRDNIPTISAPNSIGLMRYPPIPNVLSTIKGMP